VAQPAGDHGVQIARLRARLESAAPGVSLAGAWLDGVSVPDTLTCGVDAAEALLRR
jgi:protoporphyrinogen oxidase